MFPPIKLAPFTWCVISKSEKLVFDKAEINLTVLVDILYADRKLKADC